MGVNASGLHPGLLCERNAQLAGASCRPTSQAARAPVRGRALPAAQQLMKAVCVPGAGAGPDRRARRGAGGASVARRHAARAAGCSCRADGSGSGGAAPHLRRRGCRSPGSGRPRATRCWRRRAPGGRRAAPARRAQARWAGAAASAAQRRRVAPQRPSRAELRCGLLMSDDGLRLLQSTDTQQPSGEEGRISGHAGGPLARAGPHWRRARARSPAWPAPAGSGWHTPRTAPRPSRGNK